MKHRLRVIGQLSAAALCVALLSSGLATGTEPPAHPVPPLTDKQIIFQVLNRMAYGAAPGQMQDAAKLGWKNWIEQQLNPGAIDDSRLDARLADFPSLRMDMTQTFKVYRPENPPGTLTKEQLKDLNDQRQKLVWKLRNELTQADLLRAVASKRQFYEVIVGFWRNHFNVDQNKDDVAYLATDFEEHVIRRYAFGRFEDLLAATAHHPAMLIYLDNYVSQKPLTDVERHMVERFQDRSVKPRIVEALSRQHGLNENYAREVMELHTLGVDNFYTQNDVTELARVLTGWSVGKDKDGQYGFQFRKDYHDENIKELLGTRLPAQGGYEEGVRVIRGLANHVGAAHFISFELCQYLVNDNPPAELVDRVAGVFTRTGGDLPQVYRAIVTSPEFTSPANFRAKFKTPFKFVVSALRAADAQVADAMPALGALANMGQPLYQCQDPTGYYDTAEAWLDPGVLPQRWDFALRLATGKFPGAAIGDSCFTSFDKLPIEALKARLLDEVLPGAIDPHTDAMLDDAIRTLGPGRKTVQRLLGLILGSPTFQQE